ncbi:MAG: dihydropteroate synthase [Lachnospiraceae bacterium]|nr:dihydropteroate synthase [Lachnospiraceae bacterium]
MKIGNREFDLEHDVYIMGILNMTPDSFSDGGRYLDREQALFHAEQMLNEGASIIDIGGESTRPGSKPLSDEEEMERVLPIIEAIKSRIDIPISLDTYHSKTAEEGIRLGVDLVNDIYGLMYDGTMGPVVAKYDIPCVLMQYFDYTLEEMMQTADDAGILRDRIILDPGIGFGKTTEQNLHLICHPDALASYHLPMLLGASRKSVIGNVLGIPVEERLAGTVALTTAGVLAGYSIIRVHDVKENYEAAKLALAMKNA